jgi:hypothetical protein
MQTLWADLHRDQRHRFLSDAQAEVVGGCSTDVAFLRLPTAGYLVAAFDLDERTVARWQRESGAQCRRVHEHLVEAGKVALLQVQADEIRLKAVGGIYWLASAMEVRSRLWLGSVISRHRDGQLIGGLLLRVRRCGPMEKILLVTDGLSSYKSQALKLFRKPLHNGEVGRPRLVLAAGVMIARVIKRRRSRRVVEVARRVLVGREAEVISRLIATQSSILALVNTAYIERLQATFRARLAPLARRTRAGAHRRGTLEAGMWLVGVATTWCGGIALSARNAPRPWRRGSPFQKLVAGGVAGLRGAAFGDTQMAREEAEVAAGGRACSLTTVQCGATGTERVRKKVSKIVHLRDTPPVVAGVGCVSDTKITSKGASADQGIARKVRKG